MPPGVSQGLSQTDSLSYDEMVRVVRAFVALGVKKLRITGGEPLIRKDIAHLIAMCKEIQGLNEMAMTTNGINLDAMASPMREAGLARVNVSIDTLQKSKYKFITGQKY